MATFFLVRHGMCDPVGHSIAGRMPGVHLNAEGRRQAEMLVERFDGIRLDSIYTSPLERARETAAPLAQQRGLEPIVVNDMVELDFGEWTGARIDELESDPRWKLFNSARSTARIPAGETMREAQQRAVAVLHAVVGRAPDSWNIVVSHGDIIRAVIMHFLDMPLDSVHHLEVSPASISEVVVYAGGWAVVRAVNVRGSIGG